MSAVEQAAEVLAAHARCYPSFWGRRWNFVCGAVINATDVRGETEAHRAHVAQALADAGLLAHPSNHHNDAHPSLLDFDGCICGYAHPTREAVDNHLLKAGCNIFRAHLETALAAGWPQ